MKHIRHALLVLLSISLAAHAAGTVTFTPDKSGTFPATVKFDGSTKLLSVDLSSLPPHATIFRAELRLRMPHGSDRPMMPTLVYPDGQSDKPLKFVAPRYVSLDALEAVQSAVKSKQPLKLKVECTAGGVDRLEISCVEAKPKAASIPTASKVQVNHRAGQSLVTFAEPPLMPFPAFATGADVKKFVKEFDYAQKGYSFRIYRSAERITPQSVAKAQLVGECGFFTAWNNTYHQDDTDKKPPLRYSVADGAEPLSWGTGVYAHNPAQPLKAFYAVTVAMNGEEDLAKLDDGNTTASAIDETIGLGEPILQWKEEVPADKEWMYRKGPLTRLIYTRWESWPNCSVPSRPIDYLVVIPAQKVDPAPVGLHLHCWGGSVNGGYGWWYNAHRGAIMIASTQIPYDWWTGYHESRDTAKTFGDGRVQPFTMTRTFSFLDWAAKQWQEAPPAVRPYWRKLDLARVFTAGNSMGASGAPMYALRFGDRIAWSIAWVGVHVPEESPGFAGSYLNSYGKRDPAITMPDGKTSPWDWYSDVWWMRNNETAETGLIIASNGKNDGGIGWPQAVKFARRSRRRAGRTTTTGALAATGRARASVPTLISTCAPTRACPRSPIARSMTTSARPPSAAMLTWRPRSRASRMRSRPASARNWRWTRWMATPSASTTRIFHGRPTTSSTRRRRGR